MRAPTRKVSVTNRTDGKKKQKRGFSLLLIFTQANYSTTSRCGRFALGWKQLIFLPLMPSLTPLRSSYNRSTNTCTNSWLHPPEVWASFLMILADGMRPVSCCPSMTQSTPLAAMITSAHGLCWQCATFPPFPSYSSFQWPDLSILFLFFFFFFLTTQYWKPTAHVPPLIRLNQNGWQLKYFPIEVVLPVFFENEFKPKVTTHKFDCSLAYFFFFFNCSQYSKEKSLNATRIRLELPGVTNVSSITINTDGTPFVIHGTKMKIQEGNTMLFSFSQHTLILATL